MRTGTISETVLKRSVLKKITYQSPALVQGPAAGESCGRIAVEKAGDMVFATVSVTGHTDTIADRAFYRMANDVSASGGKPAGMLVTLFLPVSEEEQKLKMIMERLAALAAAYEVDFLGGHTQIAETVSEPVLSLTGTGFADAHPVVKSGNLKPGSELVMTKWAGAAGAAALVKERRDEQSFCARFSGDFLDQTEEMFQCMSSIEDAEIAVGSGVTALHSAGASGLFGALWEMGSASGVGIQVELKKIPIRQETVEVCEFFDRNPYLIPSDGVLLAGVPKGEGEKLTEIFAQAGISAAVIGTVTDDRDRVVVNGDEKRFLVPPGSQANE